MIATPCRRHPRVAPRPGLCPGGTLAGGLRHARDLLTRPENTVTSIAKLLGIARNTIYKYVPELKGGRTALTAAAGTAASARSPYGVIKP